MSQSFILFCNEPKYMQVNGSAVRSVCFLQNLHAAMPTSPDITIRKRGNKPKEDGWTGSKFSWCDDWACPLLQRTAPQDTRASPTLRPKRMVYFIRLGRPPDKQMSRGRLQTSCPIFIPQRSYDPNYCFSSFIPSSTTCQAEHRTAPAVVASVPVARMEAAAPACALEERWRGPRWWPGAPRPTPGTTPALRLDGCRPGDALTETASSPGSARA